MTLGELPLAPFSTRLDEATDGYVVTLDAAGLPTGLGVAADLRAGAAPPVVGGRRLPAAVLLPANLHPDELLASEGVTLLRLNPHGVLVVCRTTVLGVLEHPTLVAYADAPVTVPGRTRSDSAYPENTVLAGTVGVPVARLLCRCGELNEVTLYDPDRPPVCVGRPVHQLDPRVR